MKKDIIINLLFLAILAITGTAFVFVYSETSDATKFCWFFGASAANFILLFIARKIHYYDGRKARIKKEGIKTSKKLAKLSKQKGEKPIWVDDSNDIQNA